jgi:hypothetical protein
MNGEKQIENLNLEDPKHLEFLKVQLLSKRDRDAELFLNNLMKNADVDFKSSSNSVELSQQERLHQAQEKLANTSIFLAHKYQPIIEKLVSQQENIALNNKYAVIKATPLSLQDMAKKYYICFNNWIRSKDDVSIKIHDPRDLGNLNVIDVFILTYFAMLTNKRMIGDNLHQLIVSGQTSCGKTLIFESPLLDVAHLLTTEKGVNRFNCDSKSTLLLHDVNLDILVKSDSDKFKAISRAEPVPTKTFGNVQTVPAVFMFVTSNRNLLNHYFDKPEKKSFRFNRIYKSEIKTSRNVSEKDIEAVQNRFIEAFVRQRPNLPAEALPKNEVFERQHAILGLYNDIITILAQYNIQDFKIQYLYLYALCGLAKNTHLLPETDQEFHKYILYELFLKYNLDQHQIKTCCDYMKLTINKEI